MSLANGAELDAIDEAIVGEDIGDHDEFVTGGHAAFALQ